MAYRQTRGLAFPLTDIERERVAIARDKHDGVDHALALQAMNATPQQIADCALRSFQDKRQAVSRGDVASALAHETELAQHCAAYKESI